MNNTCPHPGCGAAYELSGQPVGTRFTCKQCGQYLVVDRDGLRQGSGPVAPPPVGPAGNAAAPAVAGPGAGIELPSDRGTWLFASGAIVSLCMLFFPSIDQAKVARLEAMIVAGDMRQQRLEAAGGDDKSAAEKAGERWRVRKASLEEDVESAEMWRRGWSYWYRYLSLAGFVLLLLGSLAYMDSQQPPLRRIVGSIVLTALVLVVLSSLARTGVRLEIG
jgi:hypothetical protein